ncbi:F-box family protein [Rhynchospora pubera]|uniref:F-box family protein n=1 Tax=Rhynchospora pubera TaxID=906938 RepID=A0AAV8C4H0_9POAL|nr:F-box family protein [Rhynchospora pubera]
MSMADWSDLHYDVLEHLTRFLSLSDHYRFGAVCQSWHLVQKHHPRQQLPWLVLEEDDATHKRKFFCLEENRTYLIDIPELQGRYLCGSSFGWLFTMDVKLNFRLVNPYTRKCYDLPPPPPYDSLHDSTTYAKGSISEEFYSFESMKSMLVAKAILDRDPSHSSEFKVLMMYGERNSLAFWKLGDPTWTLITVACIFFTDIIFFKEDFYAVGNFYNNNDIYLVNTGPNPNAKHVGPHVKHRGTFAYLVDYMGELLLVQRFRFFFNERFITKRIIVNKIDLEGKSYSEYKPMEGHSVFLGANSCITVDPSKYPTCRKNAIYLTDRPHNISEEHGCKDLWIYDMVEGSFSRYYSARWYIPASPIWLNPT